MQKANSLGRYCVFVRNSLNLLYIERYNFYNLWVVKVSGIQLFDD